MPEEAGIAAVAEPVESSGADETTETTSTAGAEGEGGAESGAETASGSEAEAVAPKPGAKTGKYDLSAIAKSKAEALKAIDPALPAAIQKAGYELGRFYGEFPGGLKEAVAIKQTLAEIGGPEGIKEANDALADYGALESLFEKGDPAFIERLADSLPQSFSQIMPAGLEKWKAADPEMYNHVQARVMVQTLDSARVSETIEQIWNRLDPEKQKGERDALAALWNTIDGYRQAAAKAPERKTNPQDEALNKREQELAARETRALLAPVANEGRQQIQTITDREMNSSYQWSATDPDVKEAVAERIRQEVMKASKKDKAFAAEWDRKKERGDGAGMARDLKNFQERVLQGPHGIVQRVARLFAVKPKGAGTASIKKPATVNGANGAKIEPGWVRIGKQPSAREIDYSKTTEDMIMSQKAVLRDKRKVEW